MLLVITAIPKDDSAIQKTASVTGMSVPDIRHRLAGSPPRILLTESDKSRAEEIAQALCAADIHCILLDPTHVPTDVDRIIVRRLEREGNSLVAISGIGTETRHQVAFEEIALFQQAFRINETSETKTSKERKLALGKAVITGGLAFTKTVKKTTMETHADKEPFLVIHRRGTAPELALYQNALDYGFLGKSRQPSRFANFQRTLKWLQALLPEVPIERRLLQPGLIHTLPSVPGDPVDLMLHLLLLSRLSETR